MKNARSTRIAVAVFSTTLFFSCSSAPKAPPIVLETRNQAAQFVQLGAKALRDSAVASARTFYAEAYRLYTATDDAEGRIRALDGLGRLPEADTAELWRNAARVADDSGDQKLVALAGLLDAELKLWSGDESDARKALVQARASAKILSDQPKDRSRALRVAAAAAKATLDYPTALALLDEAAGIDLKERAFVEYASDRYLAASIHSKAGNYAEARAALMDALDSDRRAENAAGIGGDYFALALVAEKSGDAATAAGYFARAADVFRAARLEEKAADAEARRDASLALLPMDTEEREAAERKGTPQEFTQGD